jgi:RNA polymerase sigma factor (sigma-70 family)
MSTLPPTDGQLLQRIAAGDEAAFRLLYERHAGWLLLRLKRRCSNSDLVAEALQDTFVAVWKSAGKWRGEGEVAAWLWGISIRQLISALRRRQGPDAASADLISAASPAVQSAEDELMLGVEHGDVGWAIRSLSPELRATVQATLIDGLSTREASRLLGLPQGTVKTRLRTAKQQLRERLIPALDGRYS